MLNEKRKLNNHERVKITWIFRLFARISTYKHKVVHNKFPCNDLFIVHALCMQHILNVREHFAMWLFEFIFKISYNFRL